MDKQTPSEELMARVAEGDEYAFQLLVNRHQTSVLNLVYRFMGDRSQSEDLAQEVFLRVWRAAKGYEQRAKFTTWLYSIASHLCFNELKASRRRKWVQFFKTGANFQTDEGEHLPSESPNPEDLLLAGERSRQITDALQSLPEKQRIALILKRYDGLSYEEISRILYCSVSAVDSLLVRAKRTLQKKLEKS
jgi:RNA polymerase sigma-70 factor (ECF subfamily)